MKNPLVSTTSAAVTLSWLCVGISLALMAARADFAISFSEPLLTVTSGAPYETDFSLWKYVNGIPVYTDLYAIPFSGSWYNWLFYAGYGEIFNAARSLFSLEDAWLPTVARLVSLTSALAGALLAYRLFVRGLPEDAPWMHPLAGAFAVYLFLGPLVGFWALSVYPEVMATATAVAGVLAFVAFYERSPMRAVLLASVFSYLAWSLKQSHVEVAGAIGLFLLVRRAWSALALLIALHLGAFAVTYALATPEFLQNTLYHLPLAAKVLGLNSSAGISFSWSTLERNIFNLTIKSLPILALAAFAPVYIATGINRWRAVSLDTSSLLAISGVLVSAVLSIPASAKDGAAENYYFGFVFFLAYAGIAMLAARIRDGKPVRLWLTAIGGGWALSALAVGLILLGVGGVVSTADWHVQLSAQKVCLKETPGPRYSSIHELALPWINPSGPYFVLSYNYAPDRAAGAVFERGGVGGLIAEGYFASVILPSSAEPEVDGASLGAYEPTGPDCAGLRVYAKKSAQP